MGINKLPNELLLKIARNLPTQDCLALSRASPDFRGPAEVHLYSSVFFGVAETDDTLTSFLTNLQADAGRRAWVHRFEAYFTYVLKRKDYELLASTLALLPRLCHLELNQYVQLPILDDLAKPLTWSHSGDPLDTHTPAPFKALAADASFLPELYSVTADLTVILRLLPGRLIQRISTDVGHWEGAPLHMFPSAAFESVKVLSTRWYAPYLSSFIVLLKNLEVLHMRGYDVDPLALRQTNIKFISFCLCSDEPLGRHREMNLFQVIPTLQCIEIDKRHPITTRIYRAQALDLEKPKKRKSRRVTWNCEEDVKWLHDWEDISLVSRRRG